MDYPEDGDPWLECERMPGEEIPEPDYPQEFDITEDEMPF